MHSGEHLALSKSHHFQERRWLHDHDDWGVALLVEQAKKLDTTSSKDVGGVASGDSSAIAAAGASMLFPAQQLARRLQTKTKAAARSRQLKRDALELLEKTDEDFTEGLSSTDAERLEQRLRAFAREYLGNIFPLGSSSQSQIPAP